MLARSSTLGRGPLRRSHSSGAALIAVVALVALLFPASHQPIASAADPKTQPKAEQCQKGLFKKDAPTKTAGCATTAAGELSGPVSIASVIPSGFQETSAFTGLTNPTVVRFAADGRIFVAEKSGNLKIFDNMADTTPTTMSVLQTPVHNFWDRGLLGMALDPSLTGGAGNGSYVYVLYAYDHILGAAPSPPNWNDGCPTPPGPTTDGCVISGRLSRFSVSGNVINPNEQVLVEDWCQQFPSHSIGSLVFGPDGALYVSGGDGASFNATDWGQFGGSAGSPTPVNPCADPSLEGGALRSQDVRNGGAGGSSYSATVAADGAISYWRLGETGTTVAADSRGTNTGTYTGSYTQGVAGALTGDANGAVTLTGGTGYINVPDSNSLDLANGPWSVELWAKRADQGSYYQLLYSKGSQGNIFFLNNKLTVDDDIDTIATESGTTTDANWHHFVVTHAPGDTKVYKDGVNVTTVVNNSRFTTSNTAALNLGRYTFLNGLNFNGSLDEVAVYPSALSGAQVANHYTAGTTSSGGGTDPTSLDGAVLRLDPNTGAGMAGNPFAGSADANSRRIIAYGLRNPFRITTRPGTNEIWVGDVGWNTWEEVNRIAVANDAVADNFGWPCYEGNFTQSGYDSANLPLCESLYSQGSGAITAPIMAYNHAAKVVTGETCPTGSSSITGMAFYPEAGGTFPASYAGGLFFADHSRNCIWFIPKGANGQPNPAAVQTFAAGAANPVDLVIGPDGALYYANFDGGTIQKISAIGGGNQPPVASYTATPSSGPAPLTVQFNASASSDPEGGALTYQWDLDGDGLYDDATGVTTQWTYTQPANVTTALKVTDPLLATGTTTRPISVGNSPPVPVIDSPASSLTWKVGDTINFSGHATDAQDGNIPASGLTWTVVLHHCPSNCHTHTVQTFTGVASGSFFAPDHEYPSYIELVLTATDSLGSQTSTSVNLDPKTVVLTFQSSPTGLSLTVDQAAGTTPFTRTVIVGSANTISATTPQTLNGLTYQFLTWSDGGQQTHTITAPATAATYTATYTTPSLTFTSNADATIRANRPTANDGASLILRNQLNKYRAYMKFTVSGLSGAASNTKLRLWVAASSSNAGSIYLVGNGWTETGITWNNAPALPGSPLVVGGSAPLGTWVEFNLGSVVTGNGTYSFAISGGAQDTVDYDSREATHDPTLVVTP